MADDVIRLDAHLDEFHRDQQWHKPVRVASTASVTISTALNSGDTIDGVTLATGDRVLLKDQSTGSQNGIYVVRASPGRAYDFLTGIQAMGSMVYVVAGTANGGKTFRNTNTSLPTIGTTALTFADYSPSSGSPSFATPAIVLGTAAAAGAASTVIRSDSTIVAFDATVPTTIAYEDTAATGSATVAARRDHRHGMAAAAGGTGEILISDTHSTPLIFADLLQTDAGDDLLYEDT